MYSHSKIMEVEKLEYAIFFRDNKRLQSDPPPSVCASFNPSVSLKSCPRNSFYIFCQINFKFCTLFCMIYEGVHVVLIFVLAIFGGFMALADSEGLSHPLLRLSSCKQVIWLFFRG